MGIRCLLSLALGLALAGAGLGWSGVVVAQESEQLLFVKAGFVLKFPSFVTWPAGSGVAEQRFDVCLQGRSDIEKFIREVARYSTVAGMKPAVRRIYGLSQISGCHLLYVADSEAGRLGEILRYVEHRPVLTVSGIPGAADKGVVIGLFLEESKVRFQINRSAAERAGLSISFRLLEAASVVQ